MDDDPDFPWPDVEDISRDGDSGPHRPLSVEEELERFRSQWQTELKASKGVIPSAPGVGNQAYSEPSIEEQAKYLFLQGVNSEQCGKLYDAIKYYRRAVQLVPDIEFRIDEYRPRRRNYRTESESSVESSTDTEVDDLVQHFTNLRANRNSAICEPDEDDKRYVGSGHIGQLPVEILMYIFKWVISSDLDIGSLAKLSEVCRGFYVCTRDEELWKSICHRAFGKNCGRPGSYGSFRNMYIEKPHVRLNGVYISRLEYYRQGEKSLDGFYRPYHVVEYYRYVRFFPDGQALMLTSPDNPYVEVPKLRHKGAKIQGILNGYYKVAGNQVTVYLRRHKVVEYTPYYHRYKPRRQNPSPAEGEQSFHVEFTLKNAGRRPCAMLDWAHYSVQTVYRSTGQEQVTDFELTNNNYPSLIFSRVKSYTSRSDLPLK